MNKRLKLKKVTLRYLDESSLSGIVGAGQTSECHASDWCSAIECPSGNGQCGSNMCTVQCTSYSLECAPTAPGTPGSQVAGACWC